MDLAFLLPWVLGTAALSAVVGMAGGMILLLALTARLPLADAMVLHGAVQLVSNGSRALMSASSIRFDIVKRFSVAAVLAALACAVLTATLASTGTFVIDTRFVLIATGIVACAEPWLGRLRLPNADTRLGGFVSGAVVATLNLTSGAAGPLLDVFYVRSALNRHENVATKAAVQSISHTLKVVYFGLLGSAGVAGAAVAGENESSLWTADAAPSFVLLALASIAGTWLGRKILDRLSEGGFRSATRAIVRTIGAVSLARGFLL